MLVAHSLAPTPLPHPSACLCVLVRVFPSFLTLTSFPSIFSGLNWEDSRDVSPWKSLQRDFCQSPEDLHRCPARQKRPRPEKEEGRARFRQIVALASDNILDVWT